MRTSPDTKYPPSNVIIEFTSNQFSGESDVTNFPAVCTGTYTLEDGGIIFENECFFTADFDWTLILKGTYQYQVTGSRLEIMRIKNDVTDKYILTLQ